MSTEIKVWQISNKQITAIEENSFAAEHLEHELENWIVQSPEILGDDLLIIGRQQSVDNVGILDLLAVNSLGELSVVELKRDKAPREAVAQALDYASWLDATSEAEILEIAEHYLQRPLDEAFAERFSGTEMPVIAPQNHRILLVCSKLDASAERIINYLAQRYSVNINAIFLRYAKLANGAEILAQSVLVAESTIQQGKPPRRKTTADELLSIAAEKKIADMVERFRALANAKYVWEEPSSTYGKSFRYWRKNVEGKAKMVVGLNISGERRGSPPGCLDIWIPKHTLARVLDLPEQETKDLLAKLPVLEMVASDNKDDCIIRLENQQAADSAGKMLQEWFEKYPGYYKPIGV